VTDLLAQLRAAHVVLDEVVGERTETQTYMRALAGFSEDDQDLILSVAKGQRHEAVIANQHGIHLVEHAPEGPIEKRFHIRTLSYSGAARTTRWLLIVLAAAIIAFLWVWDRSHQPRAVEQLAQSLRKSEPPVATHGDAHLEMAQIPLLLDLDSAPAQSARQDKFALPPVLGIQTCKEFIAAEQSNSPRLLEWWLSGFLQRDGRPADLHATSSAIATLEKHCNQHQAWKISRAIKSD
jgi:hypothetical protein